jgi:hypothetical protein
MAVGAIFAVAAAAAQPSAIDLYRDAYWAVAGGITCTPIGIEGVRKERAERSRRQRLAAVRGRLIPILGEAALTQVEHEVADETNSVSYIGCPSENEEISNRRSALAAIRKLNAFADRRAIGTK